MKVCIAQEIILFLHSLSYSRWAMYLPVRSKVGIGSVRHRAIIQNELVWNAESIPSFQ